MPFQKRMVVEQSYVFVVSNGWKLVSSDWSAQWSEISDLKSSLSYSGYHIVTTLHHGKILSPSCLNFRYFRVRYTDIGKNVSKSKFALILLSIFCMIFHPYSLVDNVDVKFERNFSNHFSEWGTFCKNDKALSFVP